MSMYREHRLVSVHCNGSFTGARSNNSANYFEKQVKTPTIVLVSVFYQSDIIDRVLFKHHLSVGSEAFALVITKRNFELG